MTVALTVGNDHMHKEAIGEMLTAFMNGRKNIPDQIKACNAQRVRADENILTCKRSKSNELARELDSGLVRRSRLQDVQLRNGCSI